MLQRVESAVPLSGVEACRRFFADCLAGASEGALWVAHLDKQARCIHLARHGPFGGPGTMPIPAILGQAARLGSAGLVLASAQRCGDVAPGSAKRQSTRSLALAAEAVDIAVVDHLTFAGDDCSSMRRMGLL